MLCAFVVSYKSRASPAEPASTNNTQSSIIALRRDEFEPTSSMVPPPFAPALTSLLLDAAVLALDVEVEDCLTCEVLVVDIDEGAFGVTVVSAITSEVVVAAPLADSIEVAWAVNEGVTVVVIAVLVAEVTAVSATEEVLVAAAEVKGYDPALLCPWSDPPRAFGHRTPVPWCWKNDPINVFGSALVPVHSAFMICVRALRNEMHDVEQTSLEKSVAVHPDSGVLYAFSQAGEKPLIC